MMKYRNILGRISIKIALIVAILCLSLLSLLDYFVIEGSKNTFNEVLSEVHLQPQNITLIDQSGKSYSIITFNPDGSKRSIPLDQKFIDKFQDSLLIVSIIGIFASFLLGYLASTIITSPLKQISEGMEKLRKNNYKLKLEKTDSIEFDKVIDEFNLLTKELQKVEELRKDLISDTSHELKTPLASLNAQLYGLKDGILEFSNERTTELLKQVDRLNDLVERLQEFSRLRSKIHKLSRVQIDFEEFIKKCFLEYEDLLSKKNIKIELDIQNDFKINADISLLCRVFYNFIENTINYSNATEIKIQAVSNKIIFHDNGIGIPKKDLIYIFERFYRVEKSRNRNTGGLGLGLAIVKEIIESHGWKITAKNIKGLTFTIKTNESAL